MRKLLIATLSVACGICLALNVHAQDKTLADTTTVKQEKYEPFGVNLQVRNLYLWRGFKVSNAPISDVDVYWRSKSGHWQAGFWGGASFTGDYREFDYYVKYVNGGFSAALWDINNFSDYPNADLFDYKMGTTSHFVDLGVAYTFQKMKLPLTLSWNTILLGRDFHYKADSSLAHSYSHYVQVDQTLYADEKYNVHAFVGGGFSFSGDKNFYGEKANVVNAGITVNRDLVVFKYHVPISATAMFNPEKKYGALQLIANIF